MSEHSDILHKISGILDYLTQNVMHYPYITFDVDIFVSEHYDIT